MSMSQRDLILAWREALQDAREALHRADTASRALADNYPIPAGIASDPRLEEN